MIQLALNVMLTFREVAEEAEHSTKSVSGIKEQANDEHRASFKQVNMAASPYRDRTSTVWSPTCCITCSSENLRSAASRPAIQMMILRNQII